METIWKVTTEGDYEGKSIHRLGIFEGNPVDIAFALADKALYTLFFTELTPKEIRDFKPSKNEVTMSFTYGSEYHKNTMSERDELFGELIQGRPVRVVHNVQGNRYVTIRLADDNDAMRRTKVERALAKLTEEEKELLGLTEERTEQ